jgi:4a-hydroxytetrahydrobiopterin dehydratase
MDPMNEKRVTAQAFHAAEGVEDWRVLYGGALAHFRTASFAEAARLVAAIADEAEKVGHFPDIDVRPEGVTVKTFTEPIGALSSVDITLARRISEVAAGMGLKSDPSRLTMVNLAVAHDPGTPVREFWAAALGYEEIDGDAMDRNRRNPSAAFHPFQTPRPGRGRLHIDVSVPADEAERRVEAALAAGGRLVEEHSRPPLWWTLISPDNHGIDIAAWPDSENFGEEG